MDQPNSKKRSRKIAGFVAVVALAVGGVSSSANAAIGWGNSQAAVTTAPPTTAAPPTTTAPRTTSAPTRYTYKFVMVNGRLTRVLVAASTPAPTTTTPANTNGPVRAEATGWGN